MYRLWQHFLQWYLQSQYNILQYITVQYMCVEQDNVALKKKNINPAYITDY